MVKLISSSAGLEKHKAEVLKLYINQEHSDLADDSTTSSTYATVKTHTLLGNTFASGFWVFACGDVSLTEANNATSGVQITIGGVQKIEAIQSTTQASGGSTDIKIQSWSVFIFIPASDGNWTPTNDVDIDVDLKIDGTGKNNTCTNLMVWGR